MRCFLHQARLSIFKNIRINKEEGRNMGKCPKTDFLFEFIAVMDNLTAREANSLHIVFHFP